MARLSVRVGGNRISGGPAFWLIAGPFILVGCIAIGAFVVASALVAVIAGAIQTRKSAP